MSSERRCGRPRSRSIAITRSTSSGSGADRLAGRSMSPTGPIRPTARRSTCAPYYGRVDEVDWTIAGRAVQLVEWARTAPVLWPLRNTDRGGRGRAGDAVPGVSAARVPSSGTGDHHPRDPRRRGPAGPRRPVPSPDVLVSGRVRRARRDPRTGRPSRGPRGGRRRARARCATGARSRGRSRTR